jgi:hypothetical protein
MSLFERNEIGVSKILNLNFDSLVFSLIQEYILYSFNEIDDFLFVNLLQPFYFFNPSYHSSSVNTSILKNSIGGIFKISLFF